MYERVGRNEEHLVHFLTQDVMGYKYDTKGFLKNLLNLWQIILRSF